MAGRAIPGRGLVEKNGFALHLAHELVAVGAFYTGVYAFERKTRAPVVIEHRWLPLGAVVTVGAGSGVTFCELFAVRVLMALLAFCRRRFEIHMNERGFEIWRLVAINTPRRAMRSQQGKRRFRMIELRQLPPGLGGVAGFTAPNLAAGSRLTHAVVELTMVRIFVTTCAAKVRPVINHCRFRLELGRLLVALGAGHGDVPSGQGKAGLFVTSQRKR